MTDDAEMVTVRCPNHHRELTNGLWNLLRASHGLDYELKCGERSVRAHGVVLRAFLPTAGSVHLAPVQQDYEIVKREPQPCDDLLDSVLEFLYKGTVTLNRELLDDLQATARQLNFLLLVDAVEETKRCKPVRIIIPRVDEILAKTSDNILRLNEGRLPRGKVDVGREAATEEARLLGSIVESVVLNGGGQSDTSATSNRQPSSSVSGFGTEKKKPSRIWNLFAPKKAKTCDAAPEVAKELPSDETLTMLQACYICHFESTSIVKLIFHQAGKHDASVLVYRCSECRSKFVTEAEMEQHCQRCGIETIRQQLNFVSDAAESPIATLKTIDRSGSQVRHHHHPPSALSWTHDGDNSTLYKCDLCHKSFGNRSHLTRHTVLHTGDQRGYKCDTCGRTFVYSSLLRAHSFTHRGQWPFECRECHKIFANRADLEQHDRTHSRAFECADLAADGGTARTAEDPTVENADCPSGKRHQCSQCNKSFARSHDLVRHLRSHTSERPYVCYECGKAFAQMFNLRSHMLTHVGRKKHKCNVCGRSFSRRADVNRHALLTHT